MTSSLYLFIYVFFFLNDTAPPEISPFPLHDALPICVLAPGSRLVSGSIVVAIESLVSVQVQGLVGRPRHAGRARQRRSEEHTSELQSPCNLVCRLLLEKKKYYQQIILLCVSFVEICR